MLSRVRWAGIVPLPTLLMRGVLTTSPRSTGPFGNASAPLPATYVEVLVSAKVKIARKAKSSCADREDGTREIAVVSCVSSLQRMLLVCATAEAQMPQYSCFVLPFREKAAFFNEHRAFLSSR